MNDAIESPSSISQQTPSIQIQTTERHIAQVPEAITTSKRKSTKRAKSCYLEDSTFDESVQYYQQLISRLNSISHTFESIRRNYCSFLLIYLFIALRELRFILTQNNINIQSKNNKAFLAQQFFQLLQNHIIIPPIPTQSNQQSQPPPKKSLLSVPVSSLLIQLIHSGKNKNHFRLLLRSKLFFVQNSHDCIKNVFHMKLVNERVDQIKPKPIQLEWKEDSISLQQEFPLISSYNETPSCLDGVSTQSSQNTIKPVYEEQLKQIIYNQAYVVNYWSCYNEDLFDFSLHSHIVMSIPV